MFLSQVSMALRPRAVAPGEVIIKKGEPGSEMYLICRGEVEVLDGSGRSSGRSARGRLSSARWPCCWSEPRTATVRARTPCDLFVLDKADFGRILRDHQQFAKAIKDIAWKRYNKPVTAEQTDRAGMSAAADEWRVTCDEEKRFSSLVIVGETSTDRPSVKALLGQLDRLADRP